MVTSRAQIYVTQIVSLKERHAFIELWQAVSYDACKCAVRNRHALDVISHSVGIIINNNFNLLI